MNAQVDGDLCSNPIVLDTIINYCSPEGFYDLANYSNSTVENPSCYPMDTNDRDVWFKFVNNFENINIIVRGNVGLGKGGSLNDPQIAIYQGSCDGFELKGCNSDARGQNLVELTIGDLELGGEYYLRVGSRSNDIGTFQLCVSNFQFTPEYDSDCPTATVLCDKSTLIVNQLAGSGDIRDEADNSCLDIDPTTNSDDGNSEVSSVWFKWVARNDGDLTFILDPINPTDDLDFAVYELPNGIDNCSDKNILRCMASGEVVGADFSVWEPCTGPTGLRTGSTDDLEWRGCDNGDDNFLAPLQMETGKSYALVVNNFSASGAGFRLEWGGSGEFSTPDAEIVFLDTKPIYCPNEPIEFYAVDRSASGAIIEYNWSFGPGASSEDLQGPGPHEISFNSGGNKPFVLSLESDIGCISPIDTFIIVEDIMEITDVVDQISCNGYDDGMIDISIDSPSPIELVAWDDGASEFLRDSLSPGDYEVTIRNQTGCVISQSYTIVEPDPLEINSIISNASCGGGMDGGIRIVANGNFPPFQYDFNDGMGFTNMDERNGLVSGIYEVTIMDDMGCSLDTSYYLNEINFTIGNSVLTEPICYGQSNGMIEILVEGGRPAYEFDYQLNGVYTSNNILSNLPAGDYVIRIRDQDDCHGFVDTTLTQPDSLSLEAEVTNISCYGLTDGSIDIEVAGGRPGYSAMWNTGSMSLDVEGLRPGNFWVEVSDISGCSIIRNYSIEEPPLLTLDLIDKMDLLCYGDRDGFIIVDGMGGSGDYTYSISGNGSGGPDFQGLSAGEYVIYLSDENNCQDSINVGLSQPDELFVNIVGDSVLNLGQTVFLQAESIPDDRMLTWQWQPADQVDCEDCQEVIAQPYSNSSFVLIGTDENGCEARDELGFKVYPIRDVGIPNVLIPSRDGPNGSVTVYAGPHVSQVLEFNVFDRWGNLLFTKASFLPNDYTLGWNGLANGEHLMPGVYVYTAEIMYLDGVTKLISGEIVLLN
ncbi:hypothetical protein GCM10025777_13730 [Membranihabitans marinus]